MTQAPAASEGSAPPRNSPDRGGADEVSLLFFRLK